MLKTTRSKNQPSWLSFNQTSKLDSHPGCHSIKTLNWAAILAVIQSNHSTGQPCWLSFTQTMKLDSHPGCHSIKPLNWTPILAVTQSNQSVNARGRQADLKGGLAGPQPPQEGSNDGGDGGVPTTLDIWRSPVLTCPGTEYPVRGIPHFDCF